MSSLDVKLQFRRISKVIAAQAEVAGGTGHASTTGSIREEIIKRFLSPHLPKHLSVRSGVIIDSKDNRSRQQDCIIVDTRLPLIDVGSDDHALILAESVIATIEVKSILNSDELSKTLESIAITKRLVRTGQQFYKKGGIEVRMSTIQPILTYIFAYDGLALDTLANKIIEFAKNNNDGGLTPEVLCLLTKGNITRSKLRPEINLKNMTATLPKIQPELTLRSLKKDALFDFYKRFIDDVIPLKISGYDINSYYSDDDLE
jgi:hypothetical protein